MGIKNLWSVLQPFCERKSLYELEGKTVAIDLAGWVCESLCVVDYEVQPRFYLRNLFFRTCFLLLTGVVPVFVLEGDAPPLKYGVICKRNATKQFRGAKAKKKTEENAEGNSKKGRSRFNYILKECETLIGCMGLMCVQGPGEAEAFCAYLNQHKLVDGVISQDSDCFAYGATKVYRNFSVSMQGSSSSQSGAVDVYDIEKVLKTIDFGQNKSIAMALLCGCDYCPDGVAGVGVTAVLKFLEVHKESDILQRIKSWQSNDVEYRALETKINNKLMCSNCGHQGRVQSHNKQGCDLCGFSNGCDGSRWKDQRLAIKSELLIRKKALTSFSDFPDETLINEFLNTTVDFPELDLEWKKPNLISFLRFTFKQLQWEEIYSFQKFLPLLTRWQLFYLSNHSGSTQEFNELISPDFIKKKRSPKGIASFEIIWKCNEKELNDLIPNEQLKQYLEEHPNGLESLWSTIEPEVLLSKAYPDIVEEFLKLKNGKTRKKNKKGDFQNGQLSDEVQKERKTKNKKPSKFTKNNNKKQNCQDLNNKISKHFAPSVGVPLNTFDISLAFDDNDDIMNMSEVIQCMTNGTPEISNLFGVNLRYECDNIENINEEKGHLNDEKTRKKNRKSLNLSSQKDISRDEFDLMVQQRPIGCYSNLDKTGQKGNTKALGKRCSYQNDFNVSYFFDHNSSICDVFERSIDFKNMPDE